jgi:hypothetical protein
MEVKKMSSYPSYKKKIPSKALVTKIVGHLADWFEEYDFDTDNSDSIYRTYKTLRALLRERSKDLK